MSTTRLLLRAYYEVAYERMASNRDRLVAAVRPALAEEIERRAFEGFDEARFSAYEDAAVSFIDERIETYNPIGIQYTFDRPATPLAFELELQLNWYDARHEFEALVARARAAVEAAGQIADDRLPELAARLLAAAGVFPDASIIAAYEAAPALSKLPDYIVAAVMRKIIT